MIIRKLENLKYINNANNLNNLKKLAAGELGSLKPGGGILMRNLNNRNN